MSLKGAFRDAWTLPIGVPGPPTTVLVARPPAFPGGPIGEAEARARSTKSAALTPRLSLFPIQVPAEEVTALLGAGAVVGGGLREPPAVAAGSTDFVRGRAGAGTPFAPGGEPLARQARPPPVDDATLQAWLQARSSSCVLFLIY